MNCLDDDTLLGRFDGELTRNEENRVDLHLSECASCRTRGGALDILRSDLVAQIPGLKAPSADAIFRRIDAQTVSANRSRRFTRASFSFAIAASLVIAVGIAELRRPPEFTARGAAAGTGVDALRRLTHLSVFADARSLVAGATVSPTAKLTAKVRNLVRDRAVYLMAFMIDSNGQMHWIYPAFEDLASDPPAVELTYSDQERQLRDGVIFDDLAIGRARIFTLTSFSRPTVKEVEGLGAPSADSLRSHFSDALINETDLFVSMPVEEMRK